MEFITFNDLGMDIVNNISRIPKDIDLVVGIPRSGVLVASMIAVYMNKPLTDIDAFMERRIYEAGVSKSKDGWIQSFDEIKKVLIVEDSVRSGFSIDTAKKKLKLLNNNIEYVYLAAYVTKEGRKKCNIFFKQIDYPRAFEWNYLHQSLILKRACFDIDGVLCEDPSELENDDGENYLTFLKTAKPKLIPSCIVGWIVTSRLEKYRAETEKWLEVNNISYDHLIMMDVETAEERRKLGNHAEYKAGHYKAIKESFIFVESSWNQAVKIHEMTGKAVFCIENRMFIGETESFKAKKKCKKTIKDMIKRIVYSKNATILRKMH